MDAATPGEVVEDQELRGLAGERTDLAWSRSGLAVLTLLAAVAKRALAELEQITAEAIVIAAICVCAVGWAIGLGWSRLIARAALEGRPVANTRVLAITAFGTTALGIAALALALLPT